MNTFRLIARLDIRGDNLIKPINLEGVRVVGEPNAFARNYFKSGIDEILLIDSVATLYGRNNLSHLVERMVEGVFIPITVGGGIRSIEDAKLLLRSGADKIAVNSAFVARPELIKDFVETFGSQSVVLSVEAKSRLDGSWEVYTHNGREKTGMSVFPWIERCQELGVGEILITSVDREGTGMGFDLELLSRARQEVEVPVIASGGFGNPADLIRALELRVDGVAIARSLHFSLTQVEVLKKFAIKSGFLARSSS